MSEPKPSPESRPVLCANGCGYFGNRETCNMCSKCYKSHVQRQQPLAEPCRADPEVAPLPVIDPLIPNTLPVDVPEDKPQQLHRNRCWACNARVGVLGLACKCGFIFCASHRYPEAHSCTFDFKTHDRQKLAAKAVKVRPSKVTQF